MGRTVVLGSEIRGCSSVWRQELSDSPASVLSAQVWYGVEERLPFSVELLKTVGSNASKRTVKQASFPSLGKDDPQPSAKSEGG